MIKREKRRNYAGKLAAGLIGLSLLLSGCGRDVKGEAEVMMENEVTSAAKETAAQTESEEVTSTPAANISTEDGAFEKALIAELAGSWRLAGDQTETHFKDYDSLQAMWGTGIHYGSAMKIGTDGSFQFYIGINYGGEGTVTEEDGKLLADTVPYAAPGNGGSPANFEIIPVTENGIQYLTTVHDSETLFWERLPEKDSIEETAPNADIVQNTDTAPNADTTLPSAFGKVLWDAYRHGTLPDGTPLDYNGTEEAEKNSFALCDVDGDGKEELLLNWSNACMAGMAEYVFGCNDGNPHLELSESTSIYYYSNGRAAADWTHNQGLSGRIWPQNHYQYNKETDTYEFSGSMTAWDKGLMEEEFPDEIDADGDGLIYYLTSPEWSEDSENRPAIDGPAYEEWLEKWLGGAEQIKPLYKTLTPENIQAMGFAEPV